MTHGPARSGAVCLTFDDGPHPEYAPRLLQMFFELGVPATFFLVGEGRAISRNRPPDRGSGSCHQEPSLSTETQHRSRSNPSLPNSFTRDHCSGSRSQEVDIFRPPPWKADDLRTLGSLAGSPEGCALECGFRRLLRTWSGTDPQRVPDRPLRASDLLLFHDNRPHCLTVLPDLIQDARARGLTFTTPDKWIN